MHDNFSTVRFGASFLLPISSPLASGLEAAAANSRHMKDRTNVRITPTPTASVPGGSGEQLKQSWRTVSDWLRAHDLTPQAFAAADAILDIRFTLDSTEKAGRLELPSSCIEEWAAYGAGFFLDAFGSEPEDTGPDSVVLTSTGPSLNEQTEVRAEWQERQQLVEAEIDRLGDSLESIDELQISLTPRTGQAGFFLEATQLFKLSSSGTRIVLLAPRESPLQN